MLDQQNQIQQLQAESSRKRTEMEAGISALEVKLTGCSKERDDIRFLLENAQNETEQLKMELSSVQAAADNEHQMDILQERFDFLQRECAEKDEGLAVMKEQLDKALEDEKRVPDLTTVIQERSVEIETLKTQFQKSQQAGTFLQHECAEKDESLAALQKRFREAQEEAKRVVELEKSVQERSVEIEALKTQFEESQMAGALLKRECAEKEENLTILKVQINKAEEEAKQVVELEKIIQNRSVETKALETKFEASQKACAESLNLLEEKKRSFALLTEQIKSLEAEKGRVEENEKSRASLAQQVKSLEGEKAKASTLRDTLRSKEEEIDRLESRLHETEHLPSKIEDLLKNLGLIGSQDSLAGSWDGIEEKLRSVVDPVKQNQKPRVKERASQPAGPRKTRVVNQKSAVPSTPLKKGPKNATHEYETTEVVYRQRRIRRSLSVSPNKMKSGNHKEVHRTQKHAEPESSIRPFSQVQWDLSSQRQSSPLSELTDLSGMFPGSPGTTKRNQAGPASVDKEKAKSFSLPSKGTGSRQTSQNVQKNTRLEVPATQFSDEDSGVEIQGGKKPHQHTLALADRDINVSIIPSSQTRKAIDAPENCLENSKTEAAKALSENRLELKGDDGRSHNSTQNQGRKMQPKGILKDTATPSSTTREKVIPRTPMREQKTGRPGIQRQPSRISSAWFHLPVSPIATRSGVTYSGKRSSQAMDPSTDNAGVQSRPKTRRRTKGKSNCSNVWDMANNTK